VPFVPHITAVLQREICTFDQFPIRHHEFRQHRIDYCQKKRLNSSSFDCEARGIVGKDRCKHIK